MCQTIFTTALWYEVGSTFNRNGKWSTGKVQWNIQVVEPENGRAGIQTQAVWNQAWAHYHVQPRQAGTWVQFVKHCAAVTSCCTEVLKCKRRVLGMKNRWLDPVCICCVIRKKMVSACSQSLPFASPWCGFLCSSILYVSSKSESCKL